MEGEEEMAERKTGEPLFKRHPLPWPLLLILLLLVVAIAVFSFVYFQNQKKIIIQEATDQLQAIADLKAREIGDWLGERLADARVIQQNRDRVAILSAYLRDRSSAARRESIRSWMIVFQENYHYENVLLLDGRGEVVLAANPHHLMVGAEGLKAIETAPRRRGVVLVDLHSNPQMPHIHMGIVAPILAGNEAMGFILLRIDPERYLFPMIQAWPTLSPSAETLLARRDGDDVLFLNELRHRKGTAMKLRFPINAGDLPAAQAARGKTGAFSGRDYRGIAVSSVIRQVPNSPWFIVAKVDREEIERPVRRSALWMSLIVLSLVLAAALLILFLWQRQNTRSRLRHMEALRESEEKFKYVFDNSVVGKSITLPDGEINVNQAFCDMLGYSPNELKAKKWQELTPADDVQRNQEALNRIISRKENSFRFEKRYLHKNGSIVWGDVSTSLRRDADGKPLYFMTSVLDITERKQAEQDLQALSIRNQALLEAVPDIIMEVDNDKVYTWANRAGLAFFGADAIGHEAAFYFEGEQKTYQTVKPVFNGYEDVIYVESWQRRRDGEKRLLAWWCRSLKDASGNVTGALSSARDITEIKLVENEIRRLNENLEQRVQERTAQLQASNQELEAFSYSVSHDLRAPLRAIDGFSRIMLEEYAPKLDDEARRLLGVIAANTRRMGRLIDDLLAFSRLNRQQLTFAPINLATLAETVFNELKGAEKGRPIEFKVGQLPPALGDLTMLGLVLQNLLANAIKFTRPRSKPRIQLSGRTEKGENIYQVKDNGIGFPMEYAHKLFGVFQRLHDSKEFEGTGVGLTIVQRIIQRHGGRVWAKSGEKGGATFYFSLPVSTPDGTAAMGARSSSIREMK
jgi:PAS domain S-box-containing protein